MRQYSCKDERSPHISAKKDQQFAFSLFLFHRVPSILTTPTVHVTTVAANTANRWNLWDYLQSWCWIFIQWERLILASSHIDIYVSHWRDFWIDEHPTMAIVRMCLYVFQKIHMKTCLKMGTSDISCFISGWTLFIQALDCFLC